MCPVPLILVGATAPAELQSGIAFERAGIIIAKPDVIVIGHEISFDARTGRRSLNKSLPRFGRGI